MAQYEIYALPLIESGNMLCALADDLKEAEGRLDAILGDLSESLHGLRKQICAERGKIAEISACAKELGRALLEITDVYAQAERYFSGGGEYSDLNAATLPTPPAPIVHRTNAVLMFSKLVLPDWLQTAVIRYEQSQPGLAAQVQST